MTAGQGVDRRELLRASDETIDDAVAFGDPAVLRAVLYQLTGDPEVAASRTVPPGRDDTLEGQVLEEDVPLIRRKTVEFLKAYRDAGAGVLDVAVQERMAASIAMAVGRKLPDGQLEFWRQALGVDPRARGLKWQGAAPETAKDFSIIVIGAGMGGLNAAIHLKQAGIRCTVIEKNPDIGGTWFENRYPGARVDTASHAYTHILGVGYNHPYPFGPWQENQKYINWLADQYGVREDIVFNTEVRSLEWNEAASLWEIVLVGPEGERIIHSHGVIPAVGFLNRPNIPDIPGQERFRGRSWHTARWPDDVDMAGQRVAVIGTGCTGYQMIPELALEASHVTVFQRTPQWIFTAPGYRSPFPPQINWLVRNLPLYPNFYRLRIGLGFDVMGGTTLAVIDPNFRDPHAVSAVNKAARQTCIAFLERKLGDPELVKKMTPAHPVGSARPVLVDPEYSILDAIGRDNVTLVTDGPARITETGIETVTGEHHDVDVIVYATGFLATEYLFPMAIKGRNGQTIEQLWSRGGARAYRGTMLPGFPNFWMLYGPNTNGSLIPPAFQEMQTVFALRCLERLLVDHKATVDVEPEAYETYNSHIDARNLGMAWSDPRARNYYWTRFGRSATQNPLTAFEMWQLLHEPDFDHLIFR